MIAINHRACLSTNSFYRGSILQVQAPHHFAPFTLTIRSQSFSICGAIDIAHLPTGYNYNRSLWIHATHTESVRYIRRGRAGRALHGACRHSMDGRLFHGMPIMLHGRACP